MAEITTKLLVSIWSWQNFTAEVNNIAKTFSIFPAKKWQIQGFEIIPAARFFREMAQITTKLLLTFDIWRNFPAKVNNIAKTFSIFPAKKWQIQGLEINPVAGFFREMAQITTKLLVTFQIWQFFPVKVNNIAPTFSIFPAKSDKFKVLK
jgi:hypothetical protein